MSVGWWAVLVLDELLDEQLGLALVARLVLGHALLRDRREQLLGGGELALLGDLGELGVDLVVADLDAARPGLLGEELGGDRSSTVCFFRLLVGRLTGGLGLRRWPAGRPTRRAGRTRPSLPPRR